MIKSYFRKIMSNHIYIIFNQILNFKLFRMKKIILFLILLIYSESFSQWIQQNSTTTVPLRRVNFINKNTGWICGDGTILKTTNGGANWINQPMPATDKLMTDIYPVNDSVVYAVGYFRTILKTTNGGSNWNVIENGPWGEGKSHYSCFFLNEHTGWIGSSAPATKKTTDGGQTFVELNVNTGPTDIFFKDSLYGIFATNGATIGTTTNGGEDWELQIIHTPGIGDERFFRISIINNLTGFVVGEQGTTYRTTNFGITWDSMGFITDVQESIFCSNFITDSIGYAGGNFSRLFKTTNAGHSWVRQNFNSHTPFDIFSLNDTTTWLCGQPGLIFNTLHGGQTSINQISQSIPNNFRLSQNYPNPFNPSTTIRFSIKNKSNYKLEVYNALGKLVDELFNKELSPGEYEYKFDGVSFTSGIYFYKLSSNQFTQTKKMILMK